MLDKSKLIIDVKCDGIMAKEVKKTIYKGLEVYAVKRSIGEELYIYSIPTAWWCGYVEASREMNDSFGGRRYLEDNIIKLSRGNKTKKYELAHVHGGYTYAAYGIPLVLNDNQRLFIGWDYNHYLDTEDCVTYQEILEEGRKVIDSIESKSDTEKD